MARIFIGMVLLVAVLSFIGVIFFGRSRAVLQGIGASTASVSEAIVADRINKNEQEVIEYKVGEDETWLAIVEKVGIDEKLGAELLAASEEAHLLASIRAGNVFRFYFDPSFSELFKLEYDIDKEEILIIEKSPDRKFEARKEKIAYRIEMSVKRGMIESSLFETAVLENIPAGVILNMAIIFGWDIDFASSVQKKDDFILAYEERFRGEKYADTGKIFAAKFVNSGAEFYAFLYEDSDGTPRYYSKEGRELKRQFLRSPLDYIRITSGFSYNRFHPILNTFTTHRAIDYAASEGTPVSVTADGAVTFVGWHGGNGQFIEVKHTNSYRTGYAHLSAYGKGIASGAKVKQNQVIGFVGSTGLSTGPHLHYEMFKDGVLINPLSVNLPPGKKLEGEKLEAFLEERDRLLKLIQ